MRAIPSSVVDTSGAPPHERFARWRAVLSPTHEVDVPDGGDPARFNAFARGWNLGHALVLETRSAPQRLRRTPRIIRADPIDHYIVRLQRRGRWIGEIDGRTVESGPGSIVVLDMARASDAQTTEIENINLLLPRDLLDNVLPPFQMHGLVLRDGLAGMLRNHLLSLVENLPRMQVAEAAHVTAATCALVAACLAPSRDAAAGAQSVVEASRLTAIRRYVDRHMHSPDLSPARICKALGLSRSALYAACGPLGGVAALIQKRRLQRVHAILAARRDPRPISEIAYQHGFVSPAHFSRAFRRTFDCTPREAREAGATRRLVGESAALASDAYQTWIRQLSA